MFPANWSILWRISAALGILAYLGGCSGMEPDFIYSSQQAEEVNRQLETLTAGPVQKHLAGAELSEIDRTNLENSLPLIDQMIQYDPITINAYALKAKVHLALGNSANAKVSLLDGIAKSKPRTDELDKTIRSEVYADLAQIQYAENDLKGAEHALVTSIELSDTTAKTHVLLGRVYQATGRTQLAKDEALKALLLDAEYEPARLFYREINSGQAASP